MNKYIVLVCLLLLSAAAYTSPYGVQVPLSSSQSMQTSYRASQTVFNMSSTSRTTTMNSSSYRPSGRFTSHVPSLNAYGVAQNPSNFRPGGVGPRRVTGGDDDDEDDSDSQYESAEPNWDSEIAPVGDIPWLFMLILLAAYLFYHAKRHRSA